MRRFAERRPEVNTLEQLRSLIHSYPTPLEFSVAELDYRDEGRASTLLGVVDYLIRVQRDFAGESEEDRIVA